MNKKQAATSLGVLALFVLFLSYLGFQVFSNLTDRITTTDALSVEVEDKVSCEGVFIRAEKPLLGDEGGLTRVLIGDGEKLAAGQIYAIRFQDARASEAYARSREIQQEIDATKFAYQSVTVSASTEAQDIGIFNGLSQLAVDLDRGIVSDVEEQYTDVSYLVVGRQYYYGNKEGYTARLEELEKEWTQCRKALTADSGKGYRAPESGYYLRYPDGLDRVFDPGRLAGFGTQGKTPLTPELIRSAEDMDLAPDPACIGSLATEFEWYYAAVMPALDAARIEKKGRCDLYFPQLSSESLRMEVFSTEYFGQEAVVVFSSRNMNPIYLDNRIQTADVVADTYTGLKVPKEALRYQDGRWGVYTLSGTVARFKPIEWICETESSYIVEPAESQKKGLYYYDKIIVTGKDISDGKVVGN